jgi:mannose-6-phosphate isomerase-like protein (cupin superfamily)
MTEQGFDLDKTYVHLGSGSIAVPLPDFRWDAAYLKQYTSRFAADGEEGRLVCLIPQSDTWTSWERHPAGEELVVLLSGRADVILELPDGQQRVELRPGQAMINPKNVWHTSDVHEPGNALFITPGAGTEHKAR